MNGVKISHVDIDMRIYDYKLRISWLNHAITQCFLLFTHYSDIIASTHELLR